jgi:hypothetical protein
MRNARTNPRANDERQAMRRPFRGVVRTGVVAGIVGTLAMDVVWYGRYRRDGGTSSFTDWEFRSEIDGFDDAPAPARVGKFVASKVNIELPDSSASLTNNVVHWSTGMWWGVVAAILQRFRLGGVKAGVITGVAAWGTSYAVLPQLGIYKPIDEYDSKTLWEDLSAHVVFGSAIGVVTSAASGVRGVAKRARDVIGSA